jgi:predicted membrane protein
LEGLRAFQIPQQKGRMSMFLVLALVLFLVWIGSFVMYHVTGFLIHLLLIFAVISLIFHFFRGKKTT